MSRAQMKRGLIHGDYWPDNTGLRYGSGEMLVLDLEHVGLGPRFADVAPWIGPPDGTGHRHHEPDQAYGWELVREGFVVLAPDDAYAGERDDPKLREPWERVLHLHPWEETAGRERRTAGICCWASPGPWKGVFDVMRGINRLMELPEVDPHRIGIIGHSKGGGTALEAML